MPLLAMSSMNQQCMLNQASLNRNAHKTGLCVDWLMTCCDQSCEQESSPAFSPESNGSAMTNSVFSRQLHRTEIPGRTRTDGISKGGSLAWEMRGTHIKQVRHSPKE